MADSHQRRKRVRVEKKNPGELPQGKRKHRPKDWSIFQFLHLRLCVRLY